MSELNELLYKNTISPWITAFANPLSAEMPKWLHPIHTGHTMFSEKFNPWMLPVEMLAPFLVKARMPADESNQCVAIEGEAGASISRMLDSYRQIRDGASEQLFFTLYGSGLTGSVPLPLQSKTGRESLCNDSPKIETGLFPSKKCCC